MRDYDRHPYEKLFVSTYGDGPWPCYGCGEDVDIKIVVIHHIDGNHANDVIANLASMHRGCHTTLHNTGRIVSAETRAKMAIALSGKTASQETRAKMSATRLGRPLGPCSDEHRMALSVARKGKPTNHYRFRCAACSLESTAAGLRSHQRGTGHHGRIETGKRMYDV